MPNFNVSKVRRAMRDFLSGGTYGITVALGLDYQNPDQKFFDELDEPYILIPGPISSDTLLYQAGNNLNSFSIELKLWLPINAYTDWDGTQLDDLISIIMSKISNEANFVDCIGPFRHTFNTPEIVHQSPSIVFQKITLDFNGVW